jgi:L-lactate dehydrogenase (cytochrome)
MTRDLLDRFPAVEYLRRAAKKRIPGFAWAHLDSGTGDESTLRLNQAAFDAVRMVPVWSEKEIRPRLKTTILGQDFEAPFGIAPLGTTGLLWPGGERILAESALAHGIPYCLSTVACETPEAIGPISGERSWFQLYPATDRAVRDDLIRRAKSSGFTTLVVTIDVPVYGMRERQRQAGLTVPPRTDVRMFLDMFARPAWTLATLRRGRPVFRTIERYGENSVSSKGAEFALRALQASVGGDYLKEIRDQWAGPLIIKGILSPEAAQRAVALGVDGLIVSNHGGRQFDAAPAAIQVLPEIVKAVGAGTTILFDSGVRGGLDIIRALALGADFVLLGRAFAYGVAALGHEGGDHVCRLVKEDLAINMKQLGAETVADIRELNTWPN